jgi:hypothetical protein
MDGFGIWSLVSLIMITFSSITIIHCDPIDRALPDILRANYNYSTLQYDILRKKDDIPCKLEVHLQRTV